MMRGSRSYRSGTIAPGMLLLTEHSVRITVATMRYDVMQVATWADDAGEIDMSVSSTAWLQASSWQLWP